MKRLLSILMLVTAATFAMTIQAAAPSKTDKRVNYTLNNLRLSAQQKQALKPLLYAYLADMKTAKKQEKDLEKRFESSIKNNTLTDAQAKQLLDARWPCDARELEVKKKYYPTFLGVIPAKKVLRLYALINDKMSKIDGKSKKSDDDDD